MKAQTLTACLVLLLTSCGGPESRSVSEALQLDEVNALLKKNPGYREAVTVAERFRESASTVELARANDLTYAQLQAFLDSVADEASRTRLRNRADEEWNRRHGATARQVPELIAHWRRYIDSLRPESYVSVRLLAIDPKESSYGTARVVLEIAPTKGAVDRVTGRFGLFRRDKEHGAEDFEAARHNTFSFERGLKTPKRIETWMQYSIWEIDDGDIACNASPDRRGIPIDRLLEKYCFDYTLTDLSVGGREIDYLELFEQVPQSVRNYWREGAEERKKREESLYGNIARELIDSSFVEHARFAREFDAAFFRNVDSLAAWLVFDRNT